MDNKIKHLEMIQSIISRMANNSFFIKGWCITIVAALLVLSSKDANTQFILIAFFPVIMFWLLDAYFLWQERLFRNLYDEIRVIEEHKIDFSMNTSSVVEKTASWFKVAISNTLILFYGAIIVAILLGVLIVNGII